MRSLAALVCLTLLSLPLMVASVLVDGLGTESKHAESSHEHGSHHVGDLREVPFAKKKEKESPEEIITDNIYWRSGLRPGKYKGVGRSDQLKYVVNDKVKRVAWFDGQSIEAVADYIDYDDTGNGIVLRTFAAASQGTGFGTRLVDELKRLHPDGIFAASLPTAFGFWSKKGFVCLAHTEERQECAHETVVDNRDQFGIMQGQGKVQENQRRRKLWHYFKQQYPGRSLISVGWKANMTYGGRVTS